MSKDEKKGHRGTVTVSFHLWSFETVSDLVNVAHNVGVARHSHEHWHKLLYLWMGRHDGAVVGGVWRRP